jgi:hypothetical protein
MVRWWTLLICAVICIAMFGVAEGDPAEFRIRIERQSVDKNLITGALSINGDALGTVYENADLKIPAGTYKGVMRYVSQKGHVLNPGGALAQTGDFLLEVANVKEADGRNREHILFHAGNKPQHSRGCILMGPAHRDPLTGERRSGDLLRVVRRLFYGSEEPKASPNVRIVVEIVDVMGG